MNREQAFDIEFIRRMRTLEREVSRLATKDPGSGIITGLTLDHLNLGAGAGATTGQLHASAHVQATQLISTIAIGTAPIVVTSTTKVTNLNADLLDGLDTSATGPAAQVVPVTDSSGNLRLTSLSINGTLDPQFSVDINGNLRAQGWIVGKHAIQLSGALMICHYDGAPPYETDYTGNNLGHLAQVATITGGVIYRPGKFGKGVQIAQGTTNLFLNPSFETNTTGYSAFGGSAIVRSAEQALYGGWSLKVTPTGITQGVNYPATAGFANTAANTISVFVYSTVNANYLLHATDSIDKDLGSTTVAVVANTWTRIVHTFTTDAHTTVTGQVWSDANAVFYLDGFQGEALGYATSYCDGSLGLIPGNAATLSESGNVVGGYSWSGTNNASTSTRVAAGLTYPTANNIYPAKGTISIWVQDTANPALNAVSPLQMIVNVASTGASCLYFFRDPATNQIVFTVKNDASTAYSTGGVALDWTVPHMITVVWATNNVRLYVDGAVAGTPVAVATMPTVFAANPICVGYQSVGPQRWFNGVLDDLVILNRVASADEIRAWYESAAPLFAETSVWAWKTPTQRVWADANGLWTIDLNGGAVLGVSSINSYSWGGLTLDAGDILMGNSASYAKWDASTATFSVSGTITSNLGAIGGWNIDSAKISNYTGPAGIGLYNASAGGPSIVVSTAAGTSMVIAPSGITLNEDNTITPPHFIFWSAADLQTIGRIAMSSGFKTGDSLQIEVFPRNGRYAEAMMGVRNYAGTLGIRHYAWWDPASSTSTTFGIYGITISGGIISPVTVAEFSFNNSASAQNRTFQTTAAVTFTTPAWATGNPRSLGVGAGAYTNCTASTEQMDVYFQLNRTVQFATGAKAVQRAFVIDLPTYSAVGATTISDAATLAITGAPAASTFITITRSHALWVQSGTVTIVDGLTVGTYSAPATGDIRLSNDLVFSATAQRIIGDMSNGTHANRLLFQTSTAAGQTNLGLIPNSASAATAFFSYNTNDPDNAGFVQFYCTATIAAINSNKFGTGTVNPLLIQMSGTEIARFPVTPSTTAAVLRITAANAGGSIAAWGVVSNLTNGSDATAASLGKLPGVVAGKVNTGWIRIDVNGATAVVPYWTI